MSRLASAVAAAALVTLLAPGASADIAPPPGYVEACTVKAHANATTECLKCGDAYHEERDACAVKYAKDGFKLACKTRGASTWSEVWCRPKGDVGGPKPDAPAKPDAPVKPTPSPDAPKAPTGAGEAPDTPAETPVKVAPKAEKKSACQGGATPAPWLLALLFIAWPLRRRLSPRQN